MTLLTVSQAAEQLGVKPATIYVWVGEKKIGHIKYPTGTIRIPQTAVDEILGNEVPVSISDHRLHNVEA